AGKSVEELLEILERQEKILRNRKFIASLPDRGKKILAYTEKVRAAIEEHKRLQKTSDLISKFKLEFEEKQNEVKEKTKFSKDASNPSLSKNTLNKEGPCNVDTTVSPFTADTVSEMSHKSNVDVGSPLVQEDKNQKTAKNDAGTANDLEDGLKMISVNESLKGEVMVHLINQKTLHTPLQISHISWKL
ncbi:unnamed protein product, partial [Staurois parvus]